MRASDGRRKVAIVSDADRLQPQAANAFLKTLEEPPNDSLLLLLSTLPEALPDTILSRCIPIPLAAPGSDGASAEEEELVELLRAIKPAEASGVQSRLSPCAGFPAPARRACANRSRRRTPPRSKREETRYKNTTDGAWLDDREDHFKALTESMYLQRRAQLVEVIFRWWSDVLRASTGSRSAGASGGGGRDARDRGEAHHPQILARLGGSKSCAISLAATSRKRSRSRSRF